MDGNAVRLLTALLTAAFIPLLGAGCSPQAGKESASDAAPPAASAGRTSAPTPEIVVEPEAPAGVAEGEVWIPPLPTFDDVKAPEGWEPPGVEQPPMPYTLLRLPRTNIIRAKYPAIDFHVHARGLTSAEAYDQLIALMDDVGLGAIVNLNGGTGADLDAVLKAGEPYRDRVATFITFSAAGINEPGWSERFAAEMERAFKAGALGMKVSKQLGQGVRNPDGSFIQADDPRLDPIWEMAAKYDRPVMIHTSDSIGRFYPISPKNERYEAGLWRKPGDTTGNLFESGPPHEVIERARENMHRKHPRTRFINAHMAMLYYDPQKLAAFLDTYPNADIELSATFQDLGRAPRLWREFILKYQDRILFGSDGSQRRDPDDFWRPHWRCLETLDEYFPHPAQVRTPSGSPGHGRWHISGLGLPDEVLRKVYYENALRHLPTLKASIERQRAARAGRAPARAE
ncbi:MAG TPA: amidohydrolase family protein [Vicinamibacterales bacterium]